MLYGVYGTLSAIINNLIAPYNYSTMDSTIIGALFIVAGVTGTIVSGILMDISKKYLFIYKMIGWLSLTCSVCIFFTMPSKNFYLLLINTTFLGYSLVPVLAIGYTISVEISYPVSEAMSNGLITMLAQIVGFVLTYIATYLAGKNPMYCIAMFTVLTSIAIIIQFFIVEDLRRVQLVKDQNQTSFRQSSSSMKMSSLTTTPPED